MAGLWSALLYVDVMTVFSPDTALAADIGEEVRLAGTSVTRHQLSPSGPRECSMVGGYGDDLKYTEPQNHFWNILKSWNKI